MKEKILEVVVQPHGSQELFRVLAPARAILGQKVAVVEWMTTETHTFLAACDPQKHSLTGCQLAFYGQIVKIGGEITC